MTDPTKFNLHKLGEENLAATFPLPQSVLDEFSFFAPQKVDEDVIEKVAREGKGKSAKGPLRPQAFVSKVESVSSAIAHLQCYGVRLAGYFQMWRNWRLEDAKAAKAKGRVPKYSQDDPVSYETFQMACDMLAYIQSVTGRLAMHLGAISRSRHFPLLQSCVQCPVAELHGQAEPG